MGCVLSDFCRSAIFLHMVTYLSAAIHSRVLHVLPAQAESRLQASACQSKPGRVQCLSFRGLARRFLQMAVRTAEHQAAISHDNIPKRYALKPCKSRALRVSSALSMIEVGEVATG